MMHQPTFPQRIIEENALTALPSACARHGLRAPLLIVCDDTTGHVAGKNAHALLGGEYHTLGNRPRALVSHAHTVAQVAHAMHAQGLVAVGGGTVNDVTKHAAHQLGLPYLCFATAASMNGYSSANASLEHDRLKQSYAATAPRAVIADPVLLGTAPRRLARAGLGDTLCRSTVVADRYLSHLVHGTPFEREVFAQLAQHEPWLMEHATLLREGAPEFMQRLMHALLDAGDAMHAHGSSAIASQSEHIVAHTLDLMYGAELHDVLHGELIAVTTVTLANLQHKMLLSQPQLRTLLRDEAQFHRQFGRKNGAMLYEQYQRKLISAEQLPHAQERLNAQWPVMKHELAQLIAPAGAIERACIEAGLATKCSGIGLSEDRYNAAMSYAHLTRDRFTFLDLAAMNARRAL